VSSPVRIGFVGTGWMGEQLLSKIPPHPHAEVAAVHDVSRRKAQEVMRSSGVDPRLFVESYEAVVADPSIDAVILVSPNAFHAPQALAALRGGKHVYSEKPNSTRWQDHLELIRTAEEHPELVTFTDYSLYFDEMGRRLKDMIEAGELGRITQAQINYRHAVNIQGDKAWKLKREIVGDAIGMGIIHSVFALVHLLSPAKAVSVFAVHHPSTAGRFEVEPIWDILIRFDTGAVGTVLGDIENGNGYDAYHNISGTRGGFVYDSLARPEGMVKYWSEGTDRQWIHPLDHEREKAAGHEDLLWPADIRLPASGDVLDHATGEIIDFFVTQVREGGKCPLGFDSMRIVQDINFAAQLSARTGSPVSLPPDPEQLRRFLGGA